MNSFAQRATERADSPAGKGSQAPTRPAGQPAEGLGDGIICFQLNSEDTATLARMWGVRSSQDLSLQAALTLKSDLAGYRWRELIRDRDSKKNAARRR